MSFQCLKPSFGSIWHMVWEMSFEEFQHGCHGGHPGYRNRTILAILNLCVTAMPPIKFWLNPTYGLGGDVVWRISIWLPWRPSWILEWNDFSNSESLCHCDASHGSSFSSIGLTVWEEMSFEEFHGFSSIQLMVLKERRKCEKPTTDDGQQAMA